MRLTEADLKFIVETVATGHSDHDHIIDLLRDKDDLLEPMLEDVKLHERLFNKLENFTRVSPYLMFAVLLRRIRRDLGKESCLFHRDADGKRIPIFAAPQAAELLNDAVMLEYLIEMLSSFARTNTALVHFKEGNGWRERKFSDADIDDMIALAQLVESELKPRLYKRIADIALFFAGIYPEHTSHWVRKRRSQDWRLARDYEREGRHFYSLVARTPQPPWPANVFERLAEEFSLICAVLSALSERYLKPLRERFGQMPGDFSGADS